MRYWNAGAPSFAGRAGGLNGAAACGVSPEVRDAEATAVNTSPATRKLRRDDSRFTKATLTFRRFKTISTENLIVQQRAAMAKKSS
jgi:hypothetical protein